MKFSVAARIRLPDAPGAARFGTGVCDGCSTVAGSPIRSLSVARGHSNCSSVSISWNRRDEENATYTPYALKVIQIDKLFRYSLVAQGRSVLLEQPGAGFRVLSLGDSIFDIGLFKPIQCDYDTIYLCERFIEISLRG